MIRMNESQTELMSVKSAASGLTELEPNIDDKFTETFELVIQPRTGWIAIDWAELWAYRELLFFLVWRDISVRYKQTVLGSAWAILQPLMLMTIFTFIFGRFAKVDSEGVPYPVFVFAGLIPWTLFSQGFPQAALSLVNQQNLLTKVYFPRIFVPVAAALVFLVDMAYSLGLYAMLLLYYRHRTQLDDRVLTGIGRADRHRNFKHWLDVLGSHRVLSRLQEHRAISHADHPVYNTGNLPGKTDLAAVIPLDSVAQSDVRHCHSLPRGHPRPRVGFPFPGNLCVNCIDLLLFGVFYFRRTERRFADFA